MPEIIARTSAKDYSIRVQSGLLDQVGSIVRSIVPGRLAMVVTDETVAEIYLGSVLKSLRQAGFQTFSFSMSEGESNKSFTVLERMYHAMAIANLTQKDVVLALGGGVVGDIAGFASATYLNGVKLIHLPTTLIAQVDSSISPETFVNMSFGKNLVGTIYHPHAVLIDPLTLRTLPRERLTDGMAEVIRYGAAADARLFDLVEAKNIELEWIVDRCVRLKVGALSMDGRQKADVPHLDFGYTLGSAIEQLTDYSVYYHGEATSIGMVLSARIGEALGHTPPEVVQRLKDVLKSWQLPTEGPPFSAEAIMAAVRSNPRLPSEKPNIVFIKDIGQSMLHPLTIEEMEAIFTKIWN